MLSSVLQELPKVGEGKLGIEGHIGYLLRQAYTSHKNRMEEVLQTLSLTLPQFTVLTMLFSYPNISNADLARLTLLTPPTMTVIIKNLEKDGYIVRVPHQEHGRIKVIQLSENGEKILTQAKILVHEVEKKLLVNVEANHEQLIRAWLVTIAK